MTGVRDLRDQLHVPFAATVVRMVGSTALPKSVGLLQTFGASTTGNVSVSISMRIWSGEQVAQAVKARAERRRNARFTTIVGQGSSPSGAPTDLSDASASHAASAARRRTMSSTKRSTDASAER